MMDAKQGPISVEPKRTIAVVGATGSQGGGVVNALQERGVFRVRALTRSPENAQGLGDEVVAADLTRPETLVEAFRDAYGVFAVTNFWAGPDIDELSQGTAAVKAAKAAGVEHFIWSTLPNVVEISHGAFDVPHFTGKAAVDDVVVEAGFRWATFVEAPFYYQNLTGQMSPQPPPDGVATFAMPMDPEALVIHMGDIAELGNVVAGAFESPETVGREQHLSLAGELMSWNHIIQTLMDQGHTVRYSRIPAETFDGLFPGAAELRATMNYFEAHTYFGPDAEAKIALAKRVSTKPFTDFAAWAIENMPATA